jgi:hypothetical protein
MSPRRIRLSGVFSALSLILSGLSTLIANSLHAQICPGGATFQSVTYVSKFTGIGSATYTATLPQFDASPVGYTLLAAVVSSTVNTTNTLALKNTKSYDPGFFQPEIKRTDGVKLNGVLFAGANAYYEGYPLTDLAGTPSPDDHITYGPGVIYDHVKVFSDSITNSGTLTGSYQGVGTLSLSYGTTFFVNSVPAEVAYTYNFFDTVTLAVTYYFCNPTTLSSDILTFTANREDDKTVALAWATTNEEGGRRYDLQVSENGQNFTVFGSVPSNAAYSDATYSYDYPIPAGVTGKLYFRLLQHETNGKVSYSELRIVDLGAASTGVFSIYPNPPADFINLTLPGGPAAWQIDIIAADGSLVQRNYYANSNVIRVNFARKLSSGAYFVRASNPQNGDHYTGSFLIQR